MVVQVIVSLHSSQAQILPMDRCFLLTAEDYCFAKQDPLQPWSRCDDGVRDVVTILRYYPHCHKLHFVRGLSEVSLDCCLHE